MTRKDNTKVAGSFFIGIAKTFYSLNAMTEIELDQLLLNIDANEWYPIEDLLSIFDALKEVGFSYSHLLYQAGRHFIQSWYDHGGKDLKLGAVGHIRLQDKSAGIQLVFKDYDPEKLYTNLIELDESRGYALIEISDILPPEFTYGVFNNGLNMWGDLLYLNVDTKILEQTNSYTKCSLTYHFKVQDETYTNDYLGQFLDAFSSTDAVELDEALVLQLIWKMKGMKKSIELEQSINQQANLVLGEALKKQVQFSKELEQANSIILEQSNIDFLTGIHNKRYFDEEYKNLWHRNIRSKESVCVFMLDIDYFKYYNDTYGHLSGDKTLKQVATCIQNTVKRYEDIAARFGGEEFVVISSNMTVDQMNQLAEKLLEEINRMEILHDTSPISDFLTISIGSACCIPTSDLIPEELISNADTALYTAKKMGRNQHQHFSSSKIQFKL